MRPGRAVAVDVHRGVDEEGCAGEDEGCRHGCLHHFGHGLRLLDHLCGDGDCSRHSTGI